MATEAPKEGSGAKKAASLPLKQALLPGEARKLKKRGKGQRTLLSEAATKASAGVMRAFLSSAPPSSRPVGGGGRGADFSEDSGGGSDDPDAYSSSVFRGALCLAAFPRPLGDLTLLDNSLPMMMKKTTNSIILRWRNEQLDTARL